MARRKSAATEGGMGRCSPSNASAWETSRSSDQMRSACLLGSEMPASRSCSVLSARSDASDVTVSGIDQLLPAGHAQRVDDRVQIAIEHVVEIVHRQIDSVISDAALRKIIGPNFGGPVTGADHGPPLPRPGGLLLREHSVEEASP